MRKGVFEPGATSIITVEVLRNVRHEKREEVKKYLEESFDGLTLCNKVILKYCEVYEYLE